MMIHHHQHLLNVIVNMLACSSLNSHRAPSLSICLLVIQPLMMLKQSPEAVRVSDTVLLMDKLVR